MNQNNVGYDAVLGFDFLGGQDSCNSNCAAQAQANIARGMNGQTGPHPAPAGAGRAPGGNESRRLEDEIRR
jgi:hypothetical protein